MPAIRSVLAAYRSTEGHITQDQITAAWSEFEEARQRLATIERRAREHADVSACHDCGLPTPYATGSYWLADDPLWRDVVGSPAIVLCPGCFTERAEDCGIAVSWRAVRDA